MRGGGGGVGIKIPYLSHQLHTGPCYNSPTPTLAPTDAKIVAYF